MNEIHFFESNYEMSKFPTTIKEHSYLDIRDRYYTQKYIKEKYPFILTTDISSITMDLIEKGYRIFLHQVGCDVIEIKLGSNSWTDKDIRVFHNIEKMYKAGAMWVENND